MILTAIFITLIHYAPALLISSSREVAGIEKGAWVLAALLPAFFHKKLALLEGSSMSISVVSLLLAWGIFVAFRTKARPAAS